MRLGIIFGKLHYFLWEQGANLWQNPRKGWKGGKGKGEKLRRCREHQACLPNHSHQYFQSWSDHSWFQ